MSGKSTAPSVEATPETDALASSFDMYDPANIDAALILARSLERRLQLAQTENAGHIRIEDELKAALREAEALCAELGKDLKDAMDALRNQA